jgi:Flp pilus assembly protein TadD
MYPFHRCLLSADASTSVFPFDCSKGRYTTLFRKSPIHNFRSYLVIWSAKADYADASGWPQEAVNAFDRALSLKSDFPKALLARGVSLAVLGRYQEALKDLNRAIDLRPDEPEYLETKSRVLRRMGRHEEAQKAFDKAMSLKLE